ncbi:MAG: hypothetical protein H7175_24335, partial [Burkholderiales bacterium]|nr:hypothetical protein [Anaerolineae bacterium]
GNYRVTQLEVAPAPDSRLLFSINDASSQMYVFDTRTGDLLNLSAVSGARGEMPRWFCRPSQITG